MKKNSMRLLGFLLAAVMMVSLFGLGVFAEDTAVADLAQLNAALDAGNTAISVTEDITVEDLEIPAGVTVTIAEGKTLRVLGTLDNQGAIEGAGTVSVSVMVYVVETRTPFEGVSYDVRATKNGSVAGNVPTAAVKYEISLDGGDTWIADTTNGKAQAVTVKTDGTTVVSSSFQSAFTSALSGETVHMLKDVHVQSTNSKKNNGPLRSYYGLILEGNGHTIFTDLESSGASNDYATIKFTSYLAGTGPDVRPVLKNVTIDSQKNAKADLDLVSGDVTFTVSLFNVNLLGNCQYASFPMKSPAMIINKSNVEIYDTVIPGWDVKSANAINIYSGSYDLSLNSTCTVYGGDYSKDPTNYVAEGYEVEKKDDGRYYVQKAVTYVAQIGDTKYETLQDAIDKAKPGDTIEVLENIDLTKTELQVLDGSHDTYFLVEGKSITIDLKGKVISGEYTGSRLIGVFSTDKNGALTLTGNGTVDVTATGTVYTLITAFNDGSSVVIENGTYKLDKASDSLIYYGGFTNAAVTVKGGSFTLGNVGSGENGKPWIFNVYGAGDHHVFITGGTFNADINRQHWANEAVVAETCYMVKNDDGTWTVKDGAVAHVATGMLTGPYFFRKNVGYATIEEAFAAAVEYDDVNITLLQNVALTKDVEISIPGIVLNANGYALDCSGHEIKLTAIDATFTASEGLNVTTNVAGMKVVYEDGTYKVVPLVYVAQIGDTKYETLADAIAAANAAENGATITLLADATVGEMMTITKDVIIEGNGKTITWADGYNGTIFNVESGVDVTLKDLTIDGENSFTFYDDTTTVENGQNWYTRFVDVGEEDKAINDNVIVNAGNLTLDSVRITGVTIASDGDNGKTANTETGGFYLMYNDDLALIKSNGGKVTINGGSIMYNAGMVLNAINAETSLNTNVMYNMGVGNKGGIIIANGGTMDIKGVITYNKAMARSATILGVINGAEVTFNAVMNYNEHIGVGPNTAGAMIVLEGASQFVMNGGTINYNEGGRAGAIASRWVGDKDISIVLNAGSIIGNTASNDSWNGASIFLRSPATIGEGMTIDGTIAVNAAPGALEITGGTFNNFDMIVTDGLTAEITGGTFDSDPTEWVAEGYEATDNGNGTYSVTLAKLAKVEVEIIPGIWGTSYITIENWADLVAALGENTNVPVKVTLLKDIKLTDEGLTIAGTAKKVIDLNGHTITGMLVNYAELIVNDETQNGKIEGGPVAIDNYGALTVNGGFFTGEYGAIYNNELESGKATVVIYGGEFTAPGDWYATVENRYGVLTVNGGKIVATNRGGYAIVDTCGETTINGGEIVSADGTAVETYQGKIVIKDGSFVGKVIVENQEGNVTVYGGTLVSNTPEYYYGMTNANGGVTVLYGGTYERDYATAEGTSVKIAEGHFSVDNGDGTFTVRKAVAKIGDTYFATLQDAIDKAEDNDEIVVLVDVKLGWDDTVNTADGKAVLLNVEGKNITLNLNGKTITVEHMATEAADRIYAVVLVADGAGLTVIGDGAIDVTANETTPRVAYLFWKRGTTGYLVIEGGEYHMNHTEDSMVYTNGSDIVTVKGGSFTLDSVGTSTNGSPWIFNAQGTGGKHILITGGTFNADINRQHWSDEAVVDKTCYVVNNGDGTWTVKAGAAAHVHTGMTTGPYFAPKEIGYATIEEAIAAAIAENDDPITLLTDFVLTAPIDTAGKTIVQNGFAIKLATVDATLTAAEGLNVTTDLEGYKVVYEDGTYKVSQVVIAEIFFSAFGGSETSVTYPGYANSLQELVDYYMLCNNANEIAIPGLSAGDYTPVLVIYGGLSAEDVAYLGGASTDGTYVSAKPMTWTVRFENGFDASNNIKAADGYVVLTNDDGTLTVTKILASITFEFLGATEHYTYPGYADGDEPIRSMHDLIDVYLTRIMDRFGMYPEDPTITLHSDIALDETFLIDAQMPLGGEYDYDLTLDLNGYTITSSVTPAIRIVDDLDVTVKNGTMDTDSYCFILGASDGSSAGNLTIESGSYTGTTSVVSVTKGTLTVLGGEFKAAESSYGATYMLNCIDANYKDGSASIIVKGGRFYGFNPENNAAEGADTNFVPMGYRASIYGTIDGVDVYDVVELKATVEAGGITYYFPGVENVDNVQELANFYFLMQSATGWILGYDYEPVLTLYAELTDEVVLGNTPSDDTDFTLPETVTWTIVTNGFNADLIKAAEGYVKIDNGDGTITIRKAVAQVGDTYFATLQDAFAACTNGETITLLVDLVYDADDVVLAHGGATGFGKYDQYNPSIIYIGGTKGATDAENQPSNVNAVLDLNGHTITNNADAYLFLFMDNCKVTIKDSKDGDGIIGNTEAPVIWVTGTDTLVTIENGKYTTANAEGLLWSTHGGDLVIKGGEFSTSADDASLLIVRNAEDRRNPNYFVDGKATVTIYGGTYYGFDPEKTMDDSTDPFTVFDACADGYKAIDNGDGSYTVKKCVVTIGSVEDLLAFGNAVTANTLYQGVKVAANPDVIVLLTADLNLTDSGFAPMGNGAANAFSGTFDGQGHIISNMTLSCNYYRGVGFFRSLGNGATIKDLTFVNADVNNGAATSANHFYGVVAGFSYNVTLDNVDIRDSKVTCKYAGSAMIGCLEGASTIKNCDIENVILNTTNIRGAVYGILGNSVNGHSATLENNTDNNVVFIVDGEIKAIKETLKYNEWANGTEYTESMYVAQIGETKYTTLADAIAAAKDGDIVTLIGNVIRASTLVVDKDVTIDFNGHTVYGSKFIQNAPVLRILAEVTVKNGAVDGRDGFSCYAFIVGNSDTAGSLTIVDGKYYGDVSVVSVTKGTLTIEGGYFEATEYNGAHEFTLNCIDANYKDGTASIVVKGGTFYKFNPENNAAEGAGTDFVPETHISVDNGDDTYTVINYIQWIKDQLLAGNDVTLDRDVVVNSDYTTSEDCQANGFGQYKNWGIFTVINGDVTFDLNGHNVTYTGHSENFCNKVAEALFYANNGAKLTIVDSSADKTGSVDVYGMATAVYSTGVGSVATVKGGTWNGYGCPECGAFNIFLYASHGGELYIEDGYFSQNGLEDSSLGSILIVEHSGAVKNLDALVDYSQTKVEITGGTFVGMDPEQAVEGYQKTWSSIVWGNTNVVAEGKMSYEVKENVWIIISADIVVKLETEGSDEVKFFSSIAEAMAEARLTAGNDTISLLKDHTESIVLVYDGTILNVEDKTLTANYLVVFKGGFLTGNAYDKDGAHGQVKIDKDRVVITEGSLPQGQGYILPVWNEDHYVFGLYGALTSGSKYGFDYDAETDTIDLTFKVKATTDINDDIMKLKGHDDHGLSVIVHVEWMGSDGLVTQDYIYTDEMVQACAGKNLYTFSIRVGERTDMRIAVKVVSDTGATLSSAEYVHNG